MFTIVSNKNSAFIKLDLKFKEKENNSQLMSFPRVRNIDFEFISEIHDDIEASI